MGNFKEQAELAENAEFIKRVRTAVGKICAQIVGEAWNEDKSVYHEKRHKLGTSALQSLDMYARKFADTITAADDTININSTDQQIENICVGVFDDLAGVKFTERP